MTFVTHDFPSAPLGRRVLVGTFLAFAVGLFLLVRSLLAPVMAVAHGGVPDGGFLLRLVVPTVAFGVAVPLFVRERALVSSFRIEDNVLVLGSKRLPLEGALAVERDPKVLCKAMRLWGNGGVGSIRGTYSSKRWGRFYAFLTSPENAVVVKWSNRAVAVSPSDPEFFVLCARKAAGLT